MKTPSYHFIGIGGIGMSGLARLLLQRHETVTGSDLAATDITRQLIQEGATIYQGHAKQHVHPESIVVYSTDIKFDNPEYLAAREMGNTLWHRSDLLAHLVKGCKGLAVTGTHGKTTTSSLLATVLNKAGRDPSFAIGGIVAGMGTNAQRGNSEYFVFEADESDRSFLKYYPFGAIVTNIDNDHLNYYQGSTQCLVEAFKTFMSQVQSSNYLFWCGDDPYLQEIGHSGQSYGFSDHCHWRAAQFSQNGFSIKFDVYGKGNYYSEVEVPLIGVHNALNALAVFALCHELGLSEKEIRDGLKAFKGAKRRCEKVGEYQSILFLDDYGHHPTEIEATLKALRQAIGSKRLVAVFQPHRYSRTQDCLGQYGSIFNEVDQLFITDIYGAGESPIAGLSAECIIKEIESTSPVPLHYSPRTQLADSIARYVAADDVVVSLGAGDITRIGKEILHVLQREKLSFAKLEPLH